MVLEVLSDKPHRFNLIRRRLAGVSQKALTQCLRRLERNGLVTRRVISLSPVAVEYEITALGRTLQKPLGALHQWTLDNPAQAMRLARPSPLENWTAPSVAFSWKNA